MEPNVKIPRMIVYAGIPSRANVECRPCARRSPTNRLYAYVRSVPIHEIDQSNSKDCMNPTWACVPFLKQWHLRTSPGWYVKWKRRTARLKRNGHLCRWKRHLGLALLDQPGWLMSGHRLIPRVDWERQGRWGKLPRRRRRGLGTAFLLRSWCSANPRSRFDTCHQWIGTSWKWPLEHLYYLALWMIWYLGPV